MQLLTRKKKNVKLEYSMAQFNPKYILPIRIRRRENSFTSKVEWKLFTLFRITEEKNSEKFSVFYRDFGHWRAQIFCGHMNVDWKKTRQSVTKLVFDWHAMCVLAKNWLVLRMTFFAIFFFVLVQASYCQCFCVNNLMQTAAQFSKKNKWKIPCIYW